MTNEAMFFYLFSAVLVSSATMVVVARNSVRAVLFLVLCFVSASGLWILLQAEFLAIVLVLVYVGAVMVMFLFVVMMLDVDQAQLKAGFARHLPLGLLVAAVMVVEMLLVLQPENFGLVTAENVGSGLTSNTKAIGRMLYTDYFYPFEIAAVVLLVGIVAAISLTLRKRPDSRYIDPSEQVGVKASDRLRMVDMESDNR
ncbi:MAG: NADH-quinone oxidoreductase subunit J [Gammaproteobacteria bacterium]|nr:NADH-quinone oxidoreductase subunit J [Gammaproteobacteria bacterium]